MHTVIKQAICVSVLQMCCKYAANMEVSNDKQTRTQLLQRLYKRAEYQNKHEILFCISECNLPYRKVVFLFVNVLKK